MNGWLRSYAIAAGLAAAIGIATFVAYRNHAYERRETDRAMQAAEAVASGITPGHHVVAAGIVLPAVQSAKYPFLKHRELWTVGEPGSGRRRLGGPGGLGTDKRLYDAANRADAGGRFVQFDRSREWVIAAAPGSHGVAVVITRPPSGPESFPWLVVLGLLAMGALVAAAGALVGGPSRPIGLALGASGLAVPAYLWSGAGVAAGIVAIAIAVALADHRGLIARARDGLSKNRIAYAFVAPTAIAMLILVAVPFVFGLVLGFYNHHHGEWTYVGLDNFIEILRGGDRSLSDPLNFWFTLGVTVLWTAVNVALHVAIGVVLALFLRQKWLFGKGVFRVLFILPWAIPNYITALIWNGMFQSEYGAVNGILEALGISGVSWFSDWATAFAANVCTNTWLGFPFMMVVALGALEAIPREQYEAAQVDGASSWQRFWHITVPHLRPALAPAIVLGAIWTFNMFNVIYLVSGGDPGGGTDILVTDAYRWAFERGERYGLASAYAVIIFLILLLWTVFGTRIHRQKETQ